MNTKLNETRHQFTNSERANRAGKSFGLNSRTSKELSSLQPLFIANTKEYFRDWCKSQGKSFYYFEKYSKLLTFAKEVKPVLERTEVRHDAELHELKQMLSDLIEEVRALKEKVSELTGEKATAEAEAKVEDKVSDVLELCTEEEIDFMRGTPEGRVYYDSYKQTGTFDLEAMRTDFTNSLCYRN